MTLSGLYTQVPGARPDEGKGIFRQLTTNEWHSDHVFRHDPNAIECFLLLTFLAYNLFHAFFALNLKAAARNHNSQVLWARLMTAEFLHEMVSINRSP